MKFSTCQRLGIVAIATVFVLHLCVMAGAFTTTLKIKGEDGKTYTAEIVAFIPVFDDEPKLLRIYDEELDAVGYILQNDMAKFLSGLVVKPLSQFDPEKAERYRQRMLSLKRRGEIE